MASSVALPARRDPSRAGGLRRGRGPPVHDRRPCAGGWSASRWASSSPSSSPTRPLNLGLEWTTFGRLRPVHTSAVIFAFGGNALLGTSLYVVQRTCRAPLFGGPLPARFLFWGYQLFIVLAASGYVLGVTQSREYAEPEWYVDLWLTVVWVALPGHLPGHDPAAPASRTSTSRTGTTSPSSSPSRCCTSSTTWRCRSSSSAPRATRCSPASRTR